MFQYLIYYKYDWLHNLNLESSKMMKKDAIFAYSEQFTHKTKTFWNDEWRWVIGVYWMDNTDNIHLSL